MKTFNYLLFLLLIIITTTGCNTLYRSQLIDIEIVEPGKLIIPKKYSTAAIKYNNSNVDYNPYYATYFIDTLYLTDTSNIDSFASKIYFESVISSLQNQVYFDSIIEISPNDFSGSYFSASPTSVAINKSDSILLNNATETLSDLYKNFQSENFHKKDTVFIDPALGLYTRQELKNIADSTNAELLISLDYYAAFDGKTFNNINYRYQQGTASVFSMGIWNFYNLKKMELEFGYNHFDTLTWQVTGTYLKELTNALPPRKDAILNTADISGERFINRFFPHWVKVQRLYYKSGHYELKETEQLIEEGNWIEAAKIWKLNINNSNKKIAAKSMFNLAVANEMEGNLDAAIDWAVKSFYIFKNKNDVHSINCQDYLKILAQRKQDLKRIELQINPEIKID